MGAAWDFTKDSVKADADMQKYNTTLKVMLGSTTAARDIATVFRPVCDSQAYTKKRPLYFELYHILLKNKALLNNLTF
jgi:hypothetical protein